MNRKTLLSSLGAAMLAHYQNRTCRDEPDGLFEIDQGEHAQPKMLRQFPGKLFIQDIIRNAL
jgi:hypothetical protein